MDARQMSAMVEATRLTRQGRLVEATALIQRTLTSSPATQRAHDGQCPGRPCSASGRHPAPSPLLPAHGGRQLGQGPSAWTHGLSVFSSLRVPDPDLAHGPAAPAATGPRAGLTPFPTPAPPAPVPTGSMSPRQHGRAPAVGRDAARRHSGRCHLRCRYRHERPRRASVLPRRLP